MTSTRFNPGDRVVRVRGHESYHTYEGEFATVIEDTGNESMDGVVKITFDNKDVFSGQAFNSYRCNLRLVEESDLFDVDE